MIDSTYKLSVLRQAKLLGFSRGSVYYLPRTNLETDLVLMRRLYQLHLDYPSAGNRMLKGSRSGGYMSLR